MIRKVLFLCTGNSCRSQIAEALVNEKLSNTWQAFSAGTEPSGFVHPKALTVLSEIGIHHSGRSKHVDELEIKAFDLLITVCDDAAEKCPIWLEQGKRIHISFPDPAKAEGTDEEIMNVFRVVRDQIDQRLLAYLQSL
jgi:arsenate reductase